MGFERGLAEESTEKIRRLLVNLVFVSYWLAIFEGALRKWVFPNFGTLLYFIKDPFVLAAYILAFKYSLWPKRNELVICSFLLAALYAVLALTQLACGCASPLVLGYGLRNYFWYIPLAFIIGENFRGKDLARFVRQTLWVCIPIAGLVYYQFKSPPDHWINRYVVADYEPSLVGEVVRTCGTFSYLTGETTFVASVLPLLFLIWFLPKHHRPIGIAIGSIASFAVIIIFLLNGSRAILFNAGLTLASAVACGLLLVGRTQLKRVAYVVAIAVLIAGASAFIMTHMFQEALEGQSQRLMEGLGSAESVEESDLVRRVASPAGWTWEALESSPLIGYGLGVGSSGGAAIATGERNMFLNENEWPRIVQESGVIGIFFIAYRCFFFLWLLVGGIRAVRRSTNPLPLLLLSFAGNILIVGQLTMGGTTTYFGWLFAGLCLAGNRLGEVPVNGQPASENFGRAGNRALEVNL